MSQAHQKHQLGFGEAAAYRIVLQGRLEQRTAAYIGDASIEKQDGGTTTLIVKVMDQAGLSGALDALYGLHLPLLSVELIARDTAKLELSTSVPQPVDAKETSERPR